MRNQARNLIEKKPAYAQFIEFYEKIYAEQERAKKLLDTASFQFKKPFSEKAFGEGFPLFTKPEMSIDVPSSVTLFRALCEISKEVNEKLQQDVTGIEQAIEREGFDIGELIRRNSDEAFIDAIATNEDLNQAVLKFLIHMSILPSLSVLVDQIRASVDTKNWLRGYCPVCGSLPLLSTLRGEGQRFLVCSFCGFEWQSERLKCAFCDNTDHQTLRYFYAEGDEACRIDLCEKCRKYIKTIDIRRFDSEPDLNLEDITTIHLDILASEQGFQRPVLTPWIVQDSP
jgi:FdhE protein